MSWFSKIIKDVAPVAPLIGGALGAWGGDELGLGAGVGGALGGALGGGLASYETGQNPFVGAGTGGIEGYFAGPAIDNSVSGLFGTTPTMPATPGAGGLSTGFSLDGSGDTAGAGAGGINLDPNGDLANNMWGAGGVPGAGANPVATAAGGIGAASGGGGVPGAGGTDAGGGIMSMFQKNPALLAALVGSVGQVAGQTGSTPAEKQIAKQAKAAAAGANGLVNAASTGQLPAGAEAQWQSALNDTITSIQSKYAQLGMSGSTSEAQEISAAQERAAGLKYQMATEATSTGLSALNLSSNLYNLLMQDQLQNDKDLSSSISNFTSALGGGQGLKAVA